MRLAEAFALASLDEIKAALNGGRLVIYSTGRPPAADHAVTRSAVLATFTLGSPAFGSDGDGVDASVTPNLAENPVIAAAVGTPSFARLVKADGTVVADLSAGPGATEVKLGEVSTTAGQPVAVAKLRMPMPPETVTWAKTEFGHVYVTDRKEPRRNLPMRG